MKLSYGRLLQRLPARPACLSLPQNRRRRAVDHAALGVFHALIPALLVALLLWCLLLLR